jgi:putative ABC transport system permease protein
LTGAVARAIASALTRERGRLAITVLALAVGVALVVAIDLVNHSALAAFGAAARILSGQADVTVAGGGAGFDESLYPILAARTEVAVASPVIELDVGLSDGDTLSVRGVDPFRLAEIDPALYAALAPSLPAILKRDAIALSAPAAAALHAAPGSQLPVRVGSGITTLTVLTVLPGDGSGARYGLMDIASAQYSLGRLKRLSRIDLRLKSGVAPVRAARDLAAILPPGVGVTRAEQALEQESILTRAYRLNLDMLALVALLTGAFLVYATQSLSVQRRVTTLALLRALGLTRGELARALVAEGAVLGLIGGLIGAGAGVLVAAFVARAFGGDLGGGFFATQPVPLAVSPVSLVVFVLLGSAVAAAGALFPARQAARIPPAQALKSGDAPESGPARAPLLAIAVLLGLGAVAAWLPAVDGIPVAGYASIACLLFGALLLVPWLMEWLLTRLPRPTNPVLSLAQAQLKSTAARSAVNLAALIVSFSLMVAMAIMVHSFRTSFIEWLDRVLPADLNLRIAIGDETAYFDGAAQTAIAGIPGIKRVLFRRSLELSLDPLHPPVLLIARDIDAAHPERILPLTAQQVTDALPVYGSEAMVDLYGWRLGQKVSLPIAGQAVPAVVAGIWRDYASSFGAIAMDLGTYRRLSQDQSATGVAIWLAPGADPAAVMTRLRPFAGSDRQLVATPELRVRSLALFDRAFALTYALEAIAIGIGLLGVSFTFGAAALARRAEFGMLRHLGLRRRDVQAALGYEGALLGTFGAAYGLLVGIVLSLVLVYVIDRQSFHWSFSWVLPVTELAVVSVTIVITAAATAVLSARAATGGSALTAVREDW